MHMNSSHLSLPFSEANPGCNCNTLLENRLWNRLEKTLAPVFQPVSANRDQWPRLKTPGFSTGALGFHWYRLGRPAGTKEAATLT